MDIIYFKNNESTILPINVGSEIHKYLLKQHISSSHIINDFKNQLYEHFNINENDFEIIFNSSSNEGNSFILKSVVDSFYLKKQKGTPIILTSTYEDITTIGTCKILQQLNKIETIFVSPDVYGMISPEDIEDKLKDVNKKIILISITHANNNIGIINKINNIGKISRKYNIPFHSDISMTVGKYDIKSYIKYIDVLTFSMDKLYGPQVGVLIIRKSLLNGYGLLPQIYGIENNGLRGGPINISGIAGSIKALNLCWQNRNLKNEKLLKLQKHLLKLLFNNFTCIWFFDLFKIKKKKNKIESNNTNKNIKLNKNIIHNIKKIDIIIYCTSFNLVCNTISFSFLKKNSQKIKKILEKNNIFISNLKSDNNEVIKNYKVSGNNDFVKQTSDIKNHKESRNDKKHKKNKLDNNKVINNYKMSRNSEHSDTESLISSNSESSSSSNSESSLSTDSKSDNSEDLSINNNINIIDALLFNFQEENIDYLIYKLKKTFISISFSDYNNITQVDEFFDIFKKISKK